MNPSLWRRPGSTVVSWTLVISDVITFVVTPFLVLLADYDILTGKAGAFAVGATSLLLRVARMLGKTEQAAPAVNTGTPASRDVLLAFTTLLDDMGDTATSAAIKSHMAAFERAAVAAPPEPPRAP